MTALDEALKECQALGNHSNVKTIKELADLQTSTVSKMSNLQKMLTQLLRPKQGPEKKVSLQVTMEKKLRAGLNIEHLLITETGESTYRVIVISKDFSDL